MIGTAALVLVLSVFNGFEELLFGLYGNFNPDVKITPAKGKVFEIDSSKIYQLKQIEGIQYVSKSVEEVAFFEYQGIQDFGILKGVDDNYIKVSGIDTCVREGIYKLHDGASALLVLGVGMRNKLNANIDNLLDPISVYMPRKEAAQAMETQFRKRLIFPVGTFITQQDNDNQYALAPIAYVQELLGNDKEISALEIKLSKEANASNTIAKISQLLGNEVIIKDRYQQEEAFLKIMNIEKWMSFAILSLTLVLVAFNMVGALWMIVLDKKRDISILKAMGSSDNDIRNIFLNEGLLLSIGGAALGFLFAILLYIAQKSFGIVPIPEGFVVDSYPISLRATDFILVAITVVGLGFMASWLPANLAKRIMDLS